MSNEKILILTQNIEIAHKLETTVLAPEDYQITISSDVDEAVELVKDNTFKLGIVGLGTQPLLAFLSQLDKKKLRLPIILLCGQDQKVIPVEVLSYGVKDYIRYPFETEDAIGALQAILRASWSETEYKKLINDLSAFNISLEERIKEATVLQGIGRSVNLSLDLDAVLNRVVEAATFITKAEEGYLMLLEEEPGELYIRAAKNMGERRAHITRLKVNDSVAGTVVQSGKPIILSGGTNKSFKVKTGYIVRSLLYVPIKIGDRVIGILGVDNPASDMSFTLDDLRRLTALADNAATTIENARIYTQTSKNLTKRIVELDVLQSLMRDLSVTSDLELIAQLVLSQAIKATQAEVGVLGWLGHGEPLWVSQGALAHQLTGISQTKGALGWNQQDLEEIIADGKPRLVTQHEAEAETAYSPQRFQSRLAVPIKWNKTTLGIINLESTRPNSFNNEDLRFVQTIANHATLALQGSNLSETIDAQREQLQLLMNGTKDAVWIVSTDFKVLNINPVASQLLGWPTKKVVGQYCSDIWPDNAGSGHRELGRFLEQAMAMGDKVSFSQGVTITLENGRTTLIEGATYPVLKQGRAIGAMAIFRQVSSDRDVERLQADFIAMASHNLRTPLMSVQASLDYILEANGEIEKNKQMLAEARSQSQKIAAFLRELLDVSQLAMGKEAPLNIKPVNFLPLLKGVIGDFSYASPDVTCELEAPKVLPLVSADEAKAKIILRNLIVHAERRSETGDTIKLIVEEKEEEIVVSVLDNGAPIPEQQHQQIFWQVYPMEVNKVNGAMPYGYGIGLFTTRRLVELLGGTIWVSQPGSHGASINFTLPIWR